MYRLYVDEVGTDQLTNLVEDKNRYLSLTGVAMRIDHARDTLEPNMDWIKANVFDHDPDDPIILHRKEIMGFKGPFDVLRDEEKRTLFDKAILRLFRSTQYVVITSLIDKEWMLRQRHWTKTHPYHYLLEILVEKYVQYLERVNSIGDIMPESRQNQDQKLQSAYVDIRDRGCDFVTKLQISARLRGDKLKFRNKKHNIAGLQLCDLLAHPSHMHVRTLMGHQVACGPFATQVVECLTSEKYDRSRNGNKIIGYGIKHLPQ